MAIYFDEFGNLVDDSDRRTTSDYSSNDNCDTCDYNTKTSDPGRVLPSGPIFDSHGNISDGTSPHHGAYPGAGGHSSVAAHSVQQMDKGKLKGIIKLLLIIFVIPSILTAATVIFQLTFGVMASGGIGTEEVLCSVVSVTDAKTSGHYPKDGVSISYEYNGNTYIDYYEVDQSKGIQVGDTFRISIMSSAPEVNSFDASVR